MRGVDGKLAFRLLAGLWVLLATVGTPAQQPQGPVAASLDTLAEQSHRPVELRSDWLHTAKAEIARSEYEVTLQPSPFEGLAEAYQAPNRAHDFRTYFTPKGIRVIPRTNPNGWEWDLQLLAAGRRSLM